MAGADSFILSSDCESFANVLIEALACGLPVLSTDCPCGPAEIIRNKESGLLIPVQDENALANGIIQLFKDKSLRNKLSVAGIKRAKDFSLKKMITEYDQLMTQVTMWNIAGAFLI